MVAHGRVRDPNGPRTVTAGTTVLFEAVVSMVLVTILPFLFILVSTRPGIQQWKLGIQQNTPTTTGIAFFYTFFTPKNTYDCTAHVSSKTSKSTENTNMNKLLGIRH